MLIEIKTLSQNKEIKFNEAKSSTYLVLEFISLS
jgi:hypothetical protein